MLVSLLFVKIVFWAKAQCCDSTSYYIYSYNNKSIEFSNFIHNFFKSIRNGNVPFESATVQCAKNNGIIYVYFAQKQEFEFSNEVVNLVNCPNGVK